PVHPGKHEVEHDDIRPLEAHLAQRLVAVLDALHRHAGVAQVRADRARDPAVVLDDEHAGRATAVHDATPAGMRGGAGGLTGGMAIRHASPTARTCSPAQRARAPSAGSSRMTSIIRPSTL